MVGRRRWCSCEPFLDGNFFVCPGIIIIPPSTMYYVTGKVGGNKVAASLVHDSRTMTMPTSHNP